MQRVLIINDSRFERLFLKDMLISLGFEAYATDEYGSLRQLENLLPEMVIVNYTMSGVTGDKLITRIKETHPLVKCLLSSCSELNPNHYPQVDGILRTPIDRDELSRMLQSMLSIEQEKVEDQDDGARMEMAASLPQSARVNYQFCPFCGEQLQQQGEGIAFCPYCGHKLSGK